MINITQEEIMQNWGVDNSTKECTAYPICIPTLNRYEHFKNCIESLSKNKLANETELVIGLDYPPNDKYIEGWKKIKEYIPSISGFGKITLFEHNSNLGAVENSRFLRAYVSSKYDACIYSEDDNIFSPYFLQYINDGLRQYKNDDSVIAVCGYSYPIDWKTEKDCVLQHQYFSAWGYGTWINKDEDIRKKLRDAYFSKNFYSDKKMKKIKKMPANFVAFMYYCFSNVIPKYDMSSSFYMGFEEKYVLMPVKTLVTNDGWDGSGEHCIKKSGLVDFRNIQRNDNTAINVISVESVFSYDLERIIISLKPRFSLFKANLKYFLIKFFGIGVTKRIIQCLREV